MLRCAVSSIRTSTKPVATSAQAVISRALACEPDGSLEIGFFLGCRIQGP